MPAPPAWTPDLLADPHAVADKRQRVRQMFTAIAPSYDLNNRLHSFGRDQSWRRAAVRLAGLRPGDDVLDVACGTGDLALAMRDALPPPAPDPTARRGSVTGVDFTFDMLPLARDKAGPADVRWVHGDAQHLPLADGSCDVVSIAFGIRNVQSVTDTLREFHRVLRPGGRVIVLEFSEPPNPLLRTLNRFYCGRVMPRTATWISRDRSGAYEYLPESVKTFMGRQAMADHLTAAGFADVAMRPMTFGVCVAYRAKKS